MGKVSQSKEEEEEERAKKVSWMMVGAEMMTILCGSSSLTAFQGKGH